MKRRVTAEEADDHVTENGTGTPKTKAQLQSLIVADLAEETDRERSKLATLALKEPEGSDERQAFEEAADILQRRRDALYAASSALLWVRMPDADQPLEPGDHRNYHNDRRA